MNSAHESDWIPLPEGGSGSLGLTSFYPIEVDHQRLGFAFGQLTGLQGIPNSDNSFEIFKWDGDKLADLATGDLKKRIGKPTISAE